MPPTGCKGLQLHHRTARQQPARGLLYKIRGTCVDKHTLESIHCCDRLTRDLSGCVIKFFGQQPQQRCTVSLKHELNKVSSGPLLVACSWKVYSQRFWMQCYGAPTPKPTKVFSNSHLIGGLAAGKKPKAAEPAIKLVRKYVDKAGKQRVVGTKQLKASQSHPQLKK